MRIASRGSGSSSLGAGCWRKVLTVLMAVLALTRGARAGTALAAVVEGVLGLSSPGGLRSPGNRCIFVLEPDFVALLTPNMQSRTLLKWSVGSDSLFGRAHDAGAPEMVELLFLMCPVI